jgi:hypothetical protein
MELELEAVKTADADAKGQDATERYDSDSDDDEKQQLNPVSVLDHPFESSPVHSKLLLSPSSKGAAVTMDVFRDLLDAAYSPALLAQLLAKSEDLLLREAARPPTRTTAATERAPSTAATTSPLPSDLLAGPARPSRLHRQAHRVFCSQHA